MRFLYVRVEARDEVFLRQADLQPFHIPDQGLRVVRHRHIDAGGILGVVPGNGAEHDGAVGHIAGQGPDLIQGGGVGDDAVAGNPAIGGFQADAAAVGCGLADGAAGVGAERGGCLLGGNRRRRTSRDPPGMQSMSHGLRVVPK